MRAVVSSLLIGLLRAYQLTVSPLLGPRCRFHPTCSHFAIEAIAQLGPIKGTWLAACRLGRCHPWGGSGRDLVSDRQHYGS